MKSMRIRALGKPSFTAMARSRSLRATTVPTSDSRPALILIAGASTAAFTVMPVPPTSISAFPRAQISSRALW